MKAITTLLLVGAALSGFAQTKTFRVGGEGRDARQIATVESVSEFETFTGRTSRVSGSVTFDPRTRLGSGTITIDMSSIDTGIPTRNDHMRSAQWLDTSKFPTATFVAKSIESRNGENFRVRGDFTMKGVTRSIVIPVRARFRAEDAATREARFQGDVLQLNTSFKIKLSDYGVTIPPIAKGKVNNEVTISVTVFATTG